MSLKRLPLPVMAFAAVCGCAVTAQTPTITVAPNSPVRSSKLYCSLVAEDPLTCFSSPVCERKFRISSEYHDPDYVFKPEIGDHNGVDIPAPVGTPVFAIADGKVVQVIRVDAQSDKASIVKVRVDGDWTYRLVHLSAIAVVEGEFVYRGQFIGLSGGEVGKPGSGVYTNGPHLHLDMTFQESFADPEPLLCRRSDR